MIQGRAMICCKHINKVNCIPLHTSGSHSPTASVHSCTNHSTSFQKSTFNWTLPFLISNNAGPESEFIYILYYWFPVQYMLSLRQLDFETKHSTFSLYMSCSTIFNVNLFYCGRKTSPHFIPRNLHRQVKFWQCLVTVVPSQLPSQVAASGLHGGGEAAPSTAAITAALNTDFLSSWALRQDTWWKFL